MNLERKVNLGITAGLATILAFGAYKVTNHNTPPQRVQDSFGLSEPISQKPPYTIVGLKYLRASAPAEEFGQFINCFDTPHTEFVGTGESLGVFDEPYRLMLRVVVTSQEPISNIFVHGIGVSANARIRLRGNSEMYARRYVQDDKHVIEVYMGYEQPLQPVSGTRGFTFWAENQNNPQIKSNPFNIDVIFEEDE
ncbi:MAG: hypothetical protein HY363_02680 [Candidatus Aenigmarchaeota archaeon]|nr:hypothetical protein [Candidatus Aenigmarchaeota archaeon]